MITRRAVLGGIAGAAVLGAAPNAVARTTARPDRGARRRVVVIGAGLAGLTTALDLRASGWDAVVLEARDRVGGRVHTLYSQFSDNLHAEAGGESIDDSHHAMLAMLKRFGLSTERRAPLKPYDSAVYYQGTREPLAAFLERDGGNALNDYLRYDDAASALADGS